MPLKRLHNNPTTLTINCWKNVFNDTENISLFISTISQLALSLQFSFYHFKVEFNCNADTQSWENHCHKFTRVQVLVAIYYGPHVLIPISMLLILHLEDSKDKNDSAVLTST